jgi:hypothetical protein
VPGDWCAAICCDDRTDAGEGIAHQPEQGAVAQADQFAGIDRVQQLAHLVTGKHRRLAACAQVLRAADGTGRGGYQDASRYQIIEQLADRSFTLGSLAPR